MSTRSLLFSLSAALAVITLTACAPHAPPAASTTSRMPGADRDEHGCIGSAGYRWCGRTQRCERPWELASAKGVENTAKAIDTYCAAPADAPPPG